jgi:hypothetical protein
MEREIGNIGNYYGRLAVKVEDGEFFWSIENYDGHNWERITEELYNALIKFDEIKSHL